MNEQHCHNLLKVNNQLPMFTASDDIPFLSIFVANTVMLMSTHGGQAESETLKVWLHILSSQCEAGIVAELQLLPE